MTKILGIFLISIGISSCNKDRIAYVDINKLYESFEYKKKLTGEFNKIKMARKRILDSLDFELNSAAQAIQQKGAINKDVEREFEERKKSVLQLGRQYEEDNQILIDSYNAKILNQLNAYIKEFGKNNSYKLIVGADNKGSILYGEEDIDITDELISYVNERFNGQHISK